MITRCFDWNFSKKKFESGKKKLQLNELSIFFHSICKAFVVVFGQLQKGKFIIVVYLQILKAKNLIK
jgi:hypothetical protein